MTECIFCKIIKKEIPTEIIYEDNNAIAFLDINPKTKGHTLVIPKKHSRNFLEIEDKELQQIMLVVKKIANAIKNTLHAGGINILQNNESAANQVVFHTHVHVIPRFENDQIRMLPGPYAHYTENEAKELIQKIGFVE